MELDFNSERKLIFGRDLRPVRHQTNIKQIVSAMFG